MKLPLEGIKILDLSQAAAGPFCTMLLGDMGAEVLKIESLDGDPFRSVLDGAMSHVINRNKRSIALDLKTDEGKEIALKLAKDADILLESFVPGTIEKLGLSYDTVKTINPDIVYCSISGYGQDGPYKHRAGYDACTQAECGLMEATGEPNGGYVRIGASIIDYGTGMFAVIGIMMALRVRDETGKGQLIDTSLFDTGMTWMNFWFANYSMTGKNPRRLGSGHEFATPYQVFETKDRPLFIGVSHDNSFRSFCEAVGLDDLLNDPKFNNIEYRLKNRDELVGIVQKKVRTFTRKEIIERIDPHGIPYGPVNTVSEVISDPHVKARGTLMEVESKGGTLKIPGFPFRLSETPGNIKRPAPCLGEHTEEILAQLGYDENGIQGLRDENVIL